MKHLIIDCNGCPECRNCGRKMKYPAWECEKCGFTTANPDEMKKIEGKDYCADCYDSLFREKEEAA